RIEQLALRIIESLVQKTGKPECDQSVEKARKVQAYIDGALTEPINLQDVAIELGMSVSKLQRVFKQAFGITVISYLRRQRLLLAYQLLRYDGQSISQVASTVQYKSNSNFSIAFKRELGVSPTEI
ncbi:MAG: AraC family transcriptional regulator, partial [Pseudomonadota bacterium]